MNRAMDRRLDVSQKKIKRCGPVALQVVLGALTGTLILAGAALAQTPAKPGSDPFAALADKETNWAKANEAKGNLRAAAYHWDMVANLTSGSAKSTAQQRANQLRTEAKSKAAQQQKDGFANLARGRRAPALFALVRSLSNDPTETTALNEIKTDLNGGNMVIPYVVAQGDTFQSIAEKNHYEDTSLAYLIGLYNPEIGENGKLKPGQTIKVPVLFNVLPKEGQVVAKGGVSPDQILGTDMASGSGNEDIARAQALLKSKKYREASELAQSVLDDDPENTEAKEVSNASNYEQGKQLYGQKKYEAALAFYERVDPSYKDTSQQIAATREVRSQAQAHYTAGLNYMLSEKVDDAIREWEATLKIDPNHQDAQKGLQEARATKEKLKQLK